MIHLFHPGQRLGIQAAWLVDQPGQRDLPAFQGKWLQGGGIPHWLIVPDKQDLQRSDLRIEQCGRRFEHRNLGLVHDQLGIFSGQSQRPHAQSGS